MSDPNPSTSTSVNGDRPPHIKKLRQASSESSSPGSPLFGGPLRPAVRRLTVSVDDPSDAPTAGGFDDRDWCFPSFLGGGNFPARSKAAVTKAAAPSVKKRMDFGNISEELSRSRLVKEEMRKMKERSEKENASKGLKGWWLNFRFSVIFALTVVTLLSSVIAVCLWLRVLELEAEISMIQGTCFQNSSNTQGGNEHFQTVYSNSLGHGSKFDSKTFALYTVVLALVTPFVVFKYLDHLPQLKTPAGSSRHNEEEVPLKKRIAYRVDVFFSVYPYAKLLALLLATILLIGFGGLALYAVSDGTLSDALWLSWTFVADSGNHADRVGLGPRIVSVSISSGGMLIFAMMLGLVSDAISEKVDSWRKGKSEVIERNHILILGWSDKLGSLLKQLAIANKSLGGGVVVVLAEREKEEMEIDIAKLEFDFMGTSVICRSGSPLILADLKKAC